MKSQGCFIIEHSLLQWGWSHFEVFIIIVYSSIFYRACTHACLGSNVILKPLQFWLKHSWCTNNGILGDSLLKLIK